MTSTAQPSKFNDLFAVKRNIEQAKATPQLKRNTKREAAQLIEPRQADVPQVEEQQRKPGKRVDPNWKMISAYIRITTKNKVDAKLAELGRQNQMSDLLEMLLHKWLQNPK